MDRRPPGLPRPSLPGQPNLPGQPPRPPAPGQLPPLPSLDRSAPPSGPAAQPVQLTGPQKLDSPEAKCSFQKSLANSIIPVNLGRLFPCSVHPCLNYTNQGQISFDLAFGQYRISIICPECQRVPRP
jgi:hypothetical protein